MKVVIIGAGEVGFHVAKALSEENYDITIIDIDAGKCQRASENLDVIVVEGNGASPKVLLEANVGDADYVLCLTKVDEINLIASQQSHELGANKIIARLRDQQYSSKESIIKPEKFGVDMNQYTVGNEANSINPNTGIMEFGFLSDLWGDIKKNAPTIGHIVGFAVGGPIGAGIGGAIGGAIKEGDLGYAAKQGVTGFAMGSMAAGAGLQGGTMPGATPTGALTNTSAGAMGPQTFTDSIGQNFISQGGNLVGAGPSLGFGAGGVTSGGVGGFLENLGANARGVFGTAGPGATGVGTAFQGLSGMEKALVGVGAIGAMGGMKTPEQIEEERTLMQNPQITEYMSRGLGQPTSFEFPSGPQLASQSMNQSSGLVPLNAGIENTALLNYLESMRAQPVSQVAYPNFEVI